MLVPAPASVYFNFVFKITRYHTYDTIHSHIVWLIRTPPLPLHCTQTIKFHLLHSFSHCHVSSLGVNKALQDIPEAYCYPDSTKNHTQRASARFQFSGRDCLKALCGKATCYLQVLSASLEESIKSILFLSLVWIPLLSSVSNNSSIFILLSY